MAMLKHGLFAALTAALLNPNASAALAAPAEPPTLYWYDGTTKMPLYRPPPRDRPSSARSAAPRAGRDAVALQPRATASGGAAGAGAAVYATGPEPRGARLVRQGPGIIFALTDGGSAERVQTWLAARGLRAEPVASGAAFKVSAVAGEQALGLANALFESGLVKYAQPNWIMEVDRRSPERNIERAMSDALSPPRQRCAALNAAISQAVMDKNGSQARAPDLNTRRYSGSANAAPGLNDGRFSDKQARLEAEYTKLGCTRLAP